MKRDRTVQTLFIGSALFFALGLGNVLFGEVRLASYRASLAKANQQITAANSSTDSSSPEPFSPQGDGSSISLERQLRLTQTLKARIDFYTLVVLGGRCMLAWAGVCLLGILVHRGLSSAGQD
ncbi:MAG: hypothetical protein EBZ48_17485 [Proteobacteria bacterium]|nr:hypothetical protein [Pseudomonadota bacterium]